MSRFLQLVRQSRARESSIRRILHTSLYVRERDKLRARRLRRSARSVYFPQRRGTGDMHMNAGTPRPVRFVTHLCCLPALLLVVLPAPAALAAPDAASAPPVSGTTNAGETDEVIVSANRLWQIRKAMIETEDRFYARYNKLNADGDFDMICGVSAPLGTRIQSRRCQVSFVIDAQFTAANAELTGGFAPPPELVLLERYDEYRRHALRIINNDPELRRLIRQREMLGARLVSRQKEIFSTRWIDW
jgi:hypothetical protein